MENQEIQNESSFEERLSRVQEIIGKIENGKMPLEESVREYERGMKMLQELDRELGEMNRRLTVLKDGKEQEMQAGGTAENL